VGWFILMGLAVIIVGSALLFRPGFAPASTERRVANGVIAGVPLLAVLITLLFSGHTVENGHIGVVKQFGSIKSTTGEGLVWVAPWRSLSQVSVRNELRTYVMDDRGARHGDVSSGAAVSKDSQPVYLDIQLNYSLVREGAVDLYRETGGQYVVRILDPAVFQITKEATAKYKATEFAANRELIRLDIQKRLQKEVGEVRDDRGNLISAININTVSLKNVDFTDALSTAIEQTVEAEQQAKREQAKVAIAQARADQKVKTAEGNARSAIAEAEGQARSNVIQAEADAKANRLRSNSLSPILVTNNAIEKMNPSVDVIYCSQGVTCVPNAVASVGVGKG